jgi:hypothetical protein
MSLPGRGSVSGLADQVLALNAKNADLLAQISRLEKALELSSSTGVQTLKASHDELLEEVKRLRALELRESKPPVGRGSLAGRYSETSPADLVVPLQEKNRELTTQIKAGQDEISSLRSKLERAASELEAQKSTMSKMSAAEAAYKAEQAKEIARLAEENAKLHQTADSRPRNRTIDVI